MPELPEVETVKNLLNKVVVGKRILSVEVIRKANIDGDSDLFVSTITGHTFLNVSRKGKFLIFHLDDRLIIISHLRMEGKYYEYGEGETHSKYAKIIFHLDGNRKLVYDDSRGFGKMKLSNEDSYLMEKEIAKIGPEPFNYKDYKQLKNRCKNIKIPIKTALLSQEFISGLGNIYVDETLYLSKIHPHTPADLITLEQWEVIVNNASKVMNKAIQMGGSTIKSYHPGKGIDGNFQNELQIYGKQGEICPHCGHRYRYIKTNGRGTTFCPGCQHKLGKPINLAITGKISSGKSTVLDLFKKKKIFTISCDEIVKDLYQQKDVANHIAKMFKLSFVNKVNRDELRDYLISHPKDIKKLDNYVHGLVKDKINEILKKNKEPLRVIEVPVLFASCMDRDFDSIIYVDMDENKRLDLQKNRDGIHASNLKKINDGLSLDNDKLFAEFIILNNSSIKELNNKVNEIINILKYRLS